MFSPPVISTCAAATPSPPISLLVIGMQSPIVLSASGYLPSSGVSCESSSLYPSTATAASVPKALALSRAKLSIILFHAIDFCQEFNFKQPFTAIIIDIRRKFAVNIGYFRRKALNWRHKYMSTESAGRISNEMSTHCVLLCFSCHCTRVWNLVGWMKKWGAE